jgi:hypothetical protein
MDRRQRIRAAVNWINLMTPLGLAVTKAGRGTISRGPGGVYVGSGYRLPVPVAGAFTIGNVISTKHGPEYLLGPGREAIFEHELRHSVQSAILGPLFLPAYFAAAGYSWLVSADWGGRNLFEQWAGLESGNYTRRPLRPALRRLLRRP